MNTFSSSRTRAHTSARNVARKASAKPVGHGHTAPAVLPRVARSDVQDEQAAGGMLRVLASMLFALPVTAGIGMLLLLIITGIALSTGDPDAMLTPLALAILGITSLLGGLVCARRCGSRPLLCGVCSGLLFTLLLWVLTLFVDRTDPTLTLGTTPWGRLALHVAVVALETAGALIGGRK